MDQTSNGDLGPSRGLCAAVDRKCEAAKAGDRPPRLPTTSGPPCLPPSPATDLALACALLVLGTATALRDRPSRPPGITPSTRASSAPPRDRQEPSRRRHPASGRQAVRGTKSKKASSPSTTDRQTGSHPDRRRRPVARNRGARQARARTGRHETEVKSGGLLPGDSGETVTDPIDSRFLTYAPFGTTSFWLQPWRAYMDTWPASRLLDGTGINFNVNIKFVEPQPSSCRKAVSSWPASRSTGPRSRTKTRTSCTRAACSPSTNDSPRCTSTGSGRSSSCSPTPTTRPPWKHVVLETTEKPRPAPAPYSSPPPARAWCPRQDRLQHTRVQGYPES